MKTKFKSLFLSLMLMISAFAVVACKKDSPKEKSQPTVEVEVAERVYYENDTLKMVDLWLKAGSTDGTLVWVNELQVLTLGENECEWKFVPTDVSSYHEKTGTVTIEAVEAKENPQVRAYITNEKVFVDKPLSTVNLALSYGDTEGTVEWIDPTQTLVLGGQICEWKFTPSDTDTYKIVYGSIRVNAVEQSVERLEVMTAPTKTDYKPFEDSVTLSGMVLKAIYDGGKVETVTSGWTVSYQNDEFVTMNDTKVIATYGGVSVDVSITVSKIELNNPQIIGEYIYNGEAQQADIKQTTYSKYYEVTGDTYTDAGTHQITITLKDTTNFKWRNSATAELVIDFIIKKAQPVYETNNYEGVFDEEFHSAWVDSDDAESIYYSLTELDDTNYSEASTDLIEIKNAGEHVVYYYIVSDSNHENVAGELTVTILKAEQVATVKYAYAIACEANANIPTNYVLSLDLNGNEIDLTDKISFKYYTNYNNGSLTTTASGATAAGGAPKNIGTYQVETTILGNENYNDVVVVSTLVIAAGDSVLSAGEDERQFAWLSSNGKIYASTDTEYNNGLNEFVLNIRNDASMKAGRVYQLDGYWFVEIDEVVYEMDIDGESMMIVNAIDCSIYAELNKWMLPYYLGTFERDTVKTDTTTPNSTIEIYNDYGVVRYTFIYYASAGAAAVTKTGTVEYYESSNSLVFKTTTGAKYFQDITTLNMDVEINSLNLQKTGISAISGEYTRVV